MLLLEMGRSHSMHLSWCSLNFWKKNVLTYSLTETGCFYSVPSSKSGQSVLPIMLTLLEVYYLCIWYLQINISEAKGLFVSCLPLLCTAHRGPAKAGQEHG